jgi:hypothetical protein
MIGIQPAMIEMASVVCFSNVKHIGSFIDYGNNTDKMRPFGSKSLVSPIAAQIVLDIQYGRVILSIKFRQTAKVDS